MNKPTVFIGCSTEGLPVGQAIQLHLQATSRVRLWNQGVFGLGQSSLEALIEAVDSSDFAVLVLRSDDEVISRAIASPVCRDNVIFELGLFMGKLGRARTFGVYDSGRPPKVISDLAGITFATFDGRDQDLISAVGPACSLIQEAMRKQLEWNEIWHTEWNLGNKIYHEELALAKDKSNLLSGVRTLAEKGEGTQFFAVQGYRGRGFYWLEYHRADGAGGGTILLHDIGTGKLRGLITAGHCDTEVLRCYKNIWSLRMSADRRPEYKPEWQQKLGEVGKEVERAPNTTAQADT